MVVFPNSKINLGLHVVSKRSDGFHNIETVFYPLQWCEALEVIEHKQGTEKFSFSQSGMPIQGLATDNSIYKAWQLICETHRLPNIRVHLHKHLPMGAGLGGGSADAAFFIRLVNEQFQLHLSIQEQQQLAARVGSDCTFFLHNQPVFAQGKGDQFSELHCDLSAYYILVVKPNVHSNTAEAYAGLKPKQPQYHLKEFIETTSPRDWKNMLTNDFETSIFQKYPAVKALKQKLYDLGAVYASMSGSGSAVYGLFDHKPTIDFPGDYLYFLQNPDKKIL